MFNILLQNWIQQACELEPDTSNELQELEKNMLIAELQKTIKEQEVCTYM